MKLIFIGPQGSGKGTQAKIISKELNLCHVSTGDLLRNLTGEKKEKVDVFMNSGKLVPDELVLDILIEHLKECKDGFILDGFPRNVSQAKKLKSLIDIDKVIEISISDKEAINRITSRVSCKNCGNVFNNITNPPIRKGVCDVCGGELFVREDDEEDFVKKRLEIYHKETEPILKLYDSVKINGEQSIEKVEEDILKELKN